MGKASFLFCFCILVAFGLVNSSSGEHEVKEKVGFYEIKRGNVSLKLTNWGATVVSFLIPDKNGKPIDIALGYDSIKEYQNDTTYFGAVVGRVANRIGGAQFKLNGKVYKLVPNEGKNMLHGGPKGFSDVIWNVSEHSRTYITFSYHSFDGEEGFPGNLRVSAHYKLLPDNQLRVTMRAKADKETPVNLAQHTYWNLGGHNSGDILSEKIQIFASKYTPVDSELIPTGKVASVEGTPYYFLKPETIGSRINDLPKGYDINYALDGGKADGSKLIKAVVLQDTKSGLTMELSTNAPGLQFYTGNMIKDLNGKDGFVYKAHAGLCLETQWYPDYVNHPKFPQSFVHPGKTYKHHMLFKFSS